MIGRIGNRMAERPPLPSFAAFVQLPLVYVGGASGDGGSWRMYRNEEFGLQVEVESARTTDGMGWRKGQSYYSLDGDDREFESLDECYQALRWHYGRERADLGSDEG